MVITKDEFLQWKSSPITNEVFGIIKERVLEAKDVLAKQAGLDSREDGFYCGMIHALTEILDISFEDGEQ
jgi:hypothetical protein